MRWQDKLDSKYSNAHMQVLHTLQKHGVGFQTEKHFPLYDRWVANGEQGKRGVIADIYLPDKKLRLECDDPYFHDPDEDAEDDAELLRVHGVRTVRLFNRFIMKRDGEEYVMSKLREVKE